MKNYKMDFRGPIHYDELTSKNVEEDFHGKREVPGIYIFGFMLNDKDEFHKGNDSPKSGRLRFIPYYVGKDSHLEKFKRIREHRNLFSNETRHLLRFSLPYMKSFFNGSEALPISHTSNKGRPKRITNNSYNSLVQTWVKESGEIVYFNDKEVLKKIYPTLKRLPSDPAIDSIKIRREIATHRASAFDDPIPDTLLHLYAGLNNFWVCYCPVIDFQRLMKTGNYSKIGSLLNELETSVYFALKGYTISTVKYKVANLEFLKSINFQCRAEIFKTRNEYQWVMNELYINGHLPQNLHASYEIFSGY